MGMFGGSNRLVTKQLENAPTAAPKLGYDDVGGLHDKISRLAGHLMLAGGNASGASAILGPLDAQTKQVSDLQKQVALAQYKLQNPEEPSIIRTLRGLNIDPHSAQGQDIGRQALVRPIVVGGGDGGAPSLIDPTRATSASRFPQGAIDRLRANPSEAAMFDEHFGAGSAASVLGGGG